MNALEFARRWYENILKDALDKEFGDAVAHIAVGKAGRGSECFGFDDDISRDHDYNPALQLWITDESDRDFGFELTRFYRKMRKEFMPGVQSASSMFGDREEGVTVIGDFYRRHLGIGAAPENFQQWLYIPEYAFAEAVNGEVFQDPEGIFTGIRNQIIHGMPEDVRLKKLAARAAMIAQSGQYNFERCLKHGENAAAALALTEFVRNTVSMIFLLNQRFAPYYKWQFRAMRSLPELSDLADQLTILLTGSMTDCEKIACIEYIAGRLIGELKKQSLSDASGNYLENHALVLMQQIRSREIRAMHIMEG